MGKALRAGLLAALVVGCARGPKLHSVTGTVKFGGKPVPVGQIFFDPDVAKGNDGPQGFATIKDGQFDTSQGGQGVIGGPHVVRIDAFDGKPGPELPLGRPLFTQHEERRELGKGPSEQHFEVPAPR